MFLGIGCLTIAALWDLRKGVVPNEIPLLLIVSFAAFVVFSGMGWHEVAPRVAVFAVATLACFAVFATDYMGGGAAKLIIATTLWLPWQIGAVFLAICLMMVGSYWLVETYSDLDIDRLFEKYATIVAILGILLLPVSTI